LRRGFILLLQERANLVLAPPRAKRRAHRGAKGVQGERTLQQRDIADVDERVHLIGVHFARYDDHRQIRPGRLRFQ
jgi:hypothetical protein